jgi:hypothetical protein
LTIARATAADIDQLRTEHNERQLKFDPTMQREPPRMNEGDLFAVSRAGNAVFRLNPFKLNFQEIEQKLSSESRPVATLGEVRAEKSQVTAERQEQRAQRQADDRMTWEFHNFYGQDGVQKANGPRGGNAVNSAISVMDGMAKVTDSLANLVADLLTFGGASHPLGDDAPKNFHQQQFEERERAAEALENIRDSIERDSSVQVRDLRNLSTLHKMDVIERGEDALRDMIRPDDDTRERERSYERER